LDKVLEYYVDIRKIYLFVTNQGHNQDTFYIAKILECLLKDEYKIVIKEERDFDPRERKKVFKFYEDFYKQNEKELSENKVLICGSGGIPAMKDAMIFYGVTNLPEVTIFDVDEKEGNVFESNVEQEYLKNFDKKVLTEMIEKFDYSGAYNFIENSKFKANIDIKNHILYLSKRYNFDLEKANNLSKNIKSKIVKKIDIENNDLLLLELMDNVEISYRK
jgi:hypothetical protein